MLSLALRCPQEKNVVLGFATPVLGLESRVLGLGLASLALAFVLGPCKDINVSISFHVQGLAKNLLLLF
jgi:hypothetical protein